MTKNLLGGYRTTKQRLIKGGERGGASNRWLERQLNDPYVQLAKEKGYRSRAAFKLLEINEKYKFLHKGMKVVDLGAAPGGWCQVAAALDCKVVAVDLLDMPLLPNVDFIVGDFTDPEIQKLMLEKMSGKADMVLSDMAPNTTGHKSTDHLRSMALVEEALYFCFENLEIGGKFLTKVFSGGENRSLVELGRTRFGAHKTIKPSSSRSESKEAFILFSEFV